jgi:hypothetical protein
MIYFIWESNMTLIPSIAAFSSKKDFEAAQEICKAKWDEDCMNGEGDYRWGVYVVTHAKSQKKLCENITYACFGFALMEAVESQNDLDELAAS